MGKSAGGENIAERLVALAKLRAAARQEAEAALDEAGFKIGQDGVWQGMLLVPGFSSRIPARVSLPEAFPDALPLLFIERSDLSRRIAHLDSTGKICVAPETGLLLDANRPRSLVKYVLDRASVEIGRGVSGDSDSELQQEFFAYWQVTDSHHTYSLCDVDGPARVLAMIRLEQHLAIAEGSMLLVDAENEGLRWARKLGVTASRVGSAFFVPLLSSFAPPEFGGKTTLQAVLSLIRTHAAKADRHKFREWLRSAELPATVALSLPEAEPGAGRRLIGIRIPGPLVQAVRQARKGFRSGHVPRDWLLAASGREPVGRLSMKRVDLGFVGNRGGAAAALAKASVLLVGVGAVGSEIAVQLAALGTGRLCMIDPDVLSPENAHRHALGMRYLWMAKSLGMSLELGMRFPHLEFDYRVSTLEKALENEPTLLDGVDLVVFAVGEETLELRVNRLLQGIVPRVHAWVEPLGIGGHALACGVTGLSPGCYECLFELTPDLGLVNRAAITAPGQEIRRSLAGCAGTFAPFSALDGRRTAMEAAELVGRILGGAEQGNALITWRGIDTAFEQEGFALSRRAVTLPAGGRTRITGSSFARAECPTCRGMSTFNTEER